MALKSRYNAKSTGTVTYGNNILVSIITLAVEEINGVDSLANKGIRTEVVDTTINVDVFINVTYGVCCTDVAYRVQENVKSSIETMTEYKMGIINVNIMGLSIKESSEGDTCIL